MSKSNNPLNPNRVADPSVGKPRSKATINRLKMYRTRAHHDKNGKLRWQELQSQELSDTRIQPDRRWFGNVHSIGQKELDTFREKLTETVHDPSQVILKSQKVPWNLLEIKEKEYKGGVLEAEPFTEVFGKNSKRKRPKLAVLEEAELVRKAQERQENYDVEKDKNIKNDDDFNTKMTKEKLYEKGQSKRIWGELWKVVDSSDIIIEVLDARDPMGTRSKHVEEHIKNHMKHKKIVLVLNKCDLVPTWATARWIQVLSKEFPTIAFHASMENPFGRGSLMNLLRQFASLMVDGDRQISVGFIGYPNSGKSSVINTLRTQKVCKVAPVAGQTKVWQYITLMKNIYLIDCPGVVHPSDDTETDIILKGVVRVENVKDPEHHIQGVLDRVKEDYMRKTYDIKQWEDAEDFLAQLARKRGKLLKGGEPDLHIVAKLILYDFQRGRLPYFIAPPTPKLNDTVDTDYNDVLKLEKQQFNQLKTEMEFNEADMKNKDEIDVDQENDMDEHVDHIEEVKDEEIKKEDEDGKMEIVEDDVYVSDDEEDKMNDEKLLATRKERMENMDGLGKNARRRKKQLLKMERKENKNKGNKEKKPRKEKPKTISRARRHQGVPKALI
ncbi:nucleolar GTP-binding protein, putative [Entamoeba invadens IP1]|uniref:nucleolar GTP-binding protein, putative n=1 Tax=Entamoeba invadens IP1 TaxID=370355 RepID=UPI0002C3D1C4|nr:nucleolar GTP-binding protein, putative [Entamoeba invadens IP1]ELP94073.1 nucleolar GTP-binding protein, putative [Entamoeba invadens IP1]|eukprot:XP_004260844.1 nucleolar GTP-binding protein, putative [Entamoeba invadens IP1]